MRQQRRTTGWIKRTVVAFGIVSGPLLLGTEGMAQNFSSDVTVTTGNAPTVIFNQDNTQTLGVQNWSLTGDETGVYLDDNTGGQTPFTVFKGAPDNSVAVASTGDVGVGTSTPTEKLHVLENVNANSFIQMENLNVGTGVAAVLRSRADLAVINFQSHSTGRTLSRFGQVLGGWGEMLLAAGNGFAIGTVANKPLLLGANNTKRVEITGTGVTVFGTFTNSSSREYKERIEAVGSAEALSALVGLRPVKFKYKGEAEENLGFIAEEMPDLVAVAGRKSIAPMDVIAVLTKVVQEQQATIVEQRRMLDEQRLELKAQQLHWEENLRALQARVTTVEQRSPVPQWAQRAE
jgi:hypothetical protein